MAAKHTLPLNSYVRFPKILRFLFVQVSVIAKTSIILTQISSFSRAAKYSNNCKCKKKKIRMYLFIFVGGEVHYGMKGAYPNNPSRVRTQTLSIQSPVRVLTTRWDKFLGLPRPYQILYQLKREILFY